MSIEKAKEALDLIKKVFGRVDAETLREGYFIFTWEDHHVEVGPRGMSGLPKSIAREVCHAFIELEF